MRKDLSNVEIVEPPIEELTKKYSAFSSIKRACLAGCGCFVLFMVGLIVLLRLAAGSGPEVIKKVPTHFPYDIPIYDADNIERITFISGKYKNRAIEIAAVFPKIILSPLLMTLDDQNAASSEDERFSTLKNTWRIVTAPVTDRKDVIKIEWRNLDAEPTFVLNYYKTELGKKGYKIDSQSTARTSQEITFSRDSISGSLYVEGNEETRPGTDYAALTIHVEPATSTTR